MDGRIGRLGLGTAQFGLDYGISNTIGRVSHSDATAIIRRALAAGMTLVDTAPAYGGAEDLLGAALPRDAPVRIVTKTISLAQGLDAVRARARQSARAVGRVPVDALLVHNAADLLTPHGADLWRLLQRLRDEGLCKRIGVSAYAEDEPLRLAGRFDIQVMQLPLSFLDQRLIADGTIRRLKDRGIEILARSLFLQGLIFLDPTRLPRSLAHAATRIAEIHGRLHDAGTSPLAAALAFVLDRPEIDAAIIGVTSLAELDQIVGAATAPSPKLDWPSLALNDPIVLNPSRW